MEQEHAMCLSAKLPVSQLSVGTWKEEVVPYKLLDFVTYLTVHIFLLLIQ